jgi:undecaprenyl-diphosphatase
MAWFDRQGRKPLLRPVAFVVRPLWRRVLVPAYCFAIPRLRFLWGRLTPGDLGLEFTTALAVAAVGSYVFVAYTLFIDDHLGPTGLDDRVTDIVNKLHTGAGIDVAKIVTALGSLPATAIALVLGAVLLVVKRRPQELTVLVVSAIAVYATVHVTKGALDRPRPPDPLAGSRLSSFPSGHAAYSTVYVALAIVAARVFSGNARRALLVVAALVLAYAIGASRAYLRVHWWSDVLAGWALGAAIFGLVAAVALVVGYFRDNGEGESAPAPSAGTVIDRA